MKFKRRIILIILLFIMLINTYCYADTTDNNLEIYSRSAILVEKNTDKILYEKNANEKMYPASTTKVMTAILTLENCNLNDMATVSKNAVTSIPSGYVNANISPGEQLSINDLLYALLVKSANDAAIVLAEHISGSVENFSELMNKKAQELGCKNTHFVNPNGIHNDDHYSTAYDLYLISKYAMQNETFKQYVSTERYTLPSTNTYEATDRTFVNTNDLIIKKSKYYNPNVIGIKTGYTSEAKNCLISAANQNGIELYCITLYAETTPEGLSERYLDTNSLFDYGFENYEYKNFLEKNTVLTNINIENATEETSSLNLLSKDTLNTLFSKTEDISKLKYNITLNENIQAPISQGDILGKIEYTIDNNSYSTELIAEHDVIEQVYYTNEYISIIAGVLLIIGLFLLFKPSKKNKKKKNKQKQKNTNTFEYNAKFL